MAQQNGLPDLPSREETSSDEENNVHYCGVLLMKNELPADGEKLKQMEHEMREEFQTLIKRELERNATASPLNLGSSFFNFPSLLNKHEKKSVNRMQHC